MKGENEMKESIVSVERDHLGRVISFQTSSGRIISYQKALQEMNEGLIYDVVLPFEQYTSDHETI